MPKGLQDLLGSPIAFRPEFAKITGNANAALVLSQCFYWSTNSVERDGWFYMTSAQWEELTGLSRREMEHSRRLLVAKGFIEVKRTGKNGALHFRTIDHTISSAVLDCTKPPNRIVQNRQTLYMESETHTKTSSKNVEAVVQRASRLPQNWELPDEWRSDALLKIVSVRPWIDIDLEAEKFRNYWTAKSTDATKLDWFRTWKNWLFNVKPPPNYRGPTSGTNGTSKTLQDKAQEFQRERDARKVPECK